MRILAATALLAATLATPASAQRADDPRAILVSAYRIALSEPVCGFTLSDDERYAAGKAGDIVEGSLKLPEDEAAKIYEETEAAMRAEQVTLCAPDGDFARGLKAAIAKLPK